MTAPTDADRTMLDYFAARSSRIAPDGLLESALAGVDRTRQRPAWRSVDWWVSATWADHLAWHGRKVAMVAVVALLIVALVAVAILGTSGQHLPPPFGLARPGAIVMDVGGDIYLAGPDGRSATKLYGGPHWDGHATFSPDGTKIAFESALDDKSTALMVMRADGGGPATLMGRLSVVDDFIAWSPDSRWIATAAQPFDDSAGPLFPSEDARIIVADVEHGTASFVGGSDLFGHLPAWSPDGTRLAFGRTYPCCSGPENGLWSMRPDGSDLQPLSTVPGGGAPAWSPDGSQIAFLGAGVDGDSDLYLVGADATGEHRVTEDAGNESLPVWSPDGTRVAFARMLDTGNRGELRVLDVHDDHVATLHGVNVTHDPPVWSPDGKSILAYVYTKADNPDHVSQYDTLGIFDVTGASAPVQIPITGLRYASWQRLAP
jgi:dipeptidyl aminopeptidase/acylaminoacyl peptidase